MSNVFLELNVETNIHVDMMTSPHILCLEVCSDPANALNPIFRIVLLVVIHLIMMMMIQLTMMMMQLSMVWSGVHLSVDEKDPVVEMLVRSRSRL